MKEVRQIEQMIQIKQTICHHTYTGWPRIFRLCLGDYSLVMQELSVKVFSWAYPLDILNYTLHLFKTRIEYKRNN